MADQQPWDVLIIGAGVSGLAAFRALSQAGCRVACLEARDRIGGRILTVRDPLSPLPVELGAEFIHGRPPETWQIVRDAPLLAYDCEENSVHLKGGCKEDESNAWEQVEEIHAGMKEVTAAGKDLPFGQFIRESSYSEKAKCWATSFVEGFNAAHKDVIGVASLAFDAQAAEAIEGDRTFRIASGYSAVPQHLLSGLENIQNRLLLNTVAESVEWQPGSVTVHTRSALTDWKQTFATRRLILTLPLGVLPDLFIRPVPATIREAAQALRFGHVMRVILRFQSAWWEQHDDLAEKGFWLSEQNNFPTWWTMLPVRAPLLTGWSAGPHADRLLELTNEEIIESALGDLAVIATRSPDFLRNELQAAYFHNWYKDPFAKGAYSYVPAGAMGCREVLASPVENTLFLGGEATETNGHSATVHGAMATGYRTARQVLASL